MSKPRILAIAGPTASGKSALAVRLATLFNGEIISCDSMQIYRRMDVGTAKPTPEEQALVCHRMIDVCEPDEPFSCADYVKMAREEIEMTLKAGKLPIVCGGTGLYLDALLRGSDFSETQVDEQLRRELEKFAEEHGNEALHKRLAEIDPESAAEIHQNNVKRVIRAIEIYETGGVKKSELDRRSRLFESPYDALVIALRYTNRDILYGRIDKRVDVMLDEGLLEETRQLLGEGIFEKNTTASQAIGYKEMLGYLAGEMSLFDAAEQLKTATRRYAKRQMTWFSSKGYVSWIDADCNGEMRPFEDIVNDALVLIGETKQ